MTILISGATGHIGRLIISRLLEQGETVRALTRDPATAALPDAVAITKGELADMPDSGFDDVTAVFLFPADTGADSFVERAVERGIGRFVVLSSLAVSDRMPRDSESITHHHHRAVEGAVTTRTDEWTILRPGNFANNLLSWAFPIRSGFPVRVPYPLSSQVLISERDVAAAAALTLTEPGHEGRIYELTGPRSLTKVEQLAAIAEAIGREVPYVEVSPDEFRSDVAPYISSELTDMLLRYWSETVDEPEIPVAAPLGLTLTPFADWARDHRADFGG